MKFFRKMVHYLNLKYPSSKHRKINSSILKQFPKCGQIRPRGAADIQRRRLKRRNKMWKSWRNSPKQNTIQNMAKRTNPTKKESHLSLGNDEQWTQTQQSVGINGNDGKSVARQLKVGHDTNNLNFVSFPATFRSVCHFDCLETRQQQQQQQQQQKMLRKRRKNHQMTAIPPPLPQFPCQGRSMAFFNQLIWLEPDRDGLINRRTIR